MNFAFRLIGWYMVGNEKQRQTTNKKSRKTSKSNREHKTARQYYGSSPITTNIQRRNRCPHRGRLAFSHLTFAPARLPASLRAWQQATSGYPRKKLALRSERRRATSFNAPRPSPKNKTSPTSPRHPISSRPLIRPPNHPLTHPPTRLPTHPTYPLTHPSTITHPLTNPLIPTNPPTHSLTHPPTHPLAPHLRQPHPLVRGVPVATSERAERHILRQSLRRVDAVRRVHASHHHVGPQPHRP